MAATAAEGDPCIVGDRASDGGTAPGGGAVAMVGEADGVPQRPVPCRSGVHPRLARGVHGGGRQIAEGARFGGPTN